MLETRIRVEHRDPTPADEGVYCPECGRPLNLIASTPPDAPERSVWWAAIAIAVGLYLLANYGALAQEASQTQPSVGIASIGAMTVLVGLGVLVRRRLRWERRGGIAATCISFWSFGEGLFLALLCLALSAYGYLLARELFSGAPLTWTVASHTANRLVQVLVYAAQTAAAGFTVPTCPCSS